MREVNVSKITDAVKQLCIETNRILPADLEETICKACKTETNDTGKAILNDLCRNMDAAREMQIPICQDRHGSSVCGSRTRRSFHWRRF